MRVDWNTAGENQAADKHITPVVWSIKTSLSAVCPRSRTQLQSVRPHLERLRPHRRTRGPGSVAFIQSPLAVQVVGIGRHGFGLLTGNGALQRLNRCVLQAWLPEVDQGAG
ncbi:MAG: hypothetical protein R3E42_09540 [Burkholderiaceae bacterium]